MTPEQLAQFLAQQNQPGDASDLDRLDEREMEVFSILSQGYTASQIQSEFGIDRARLAATKQSIQKKLGLKSELELLRRIARYTHGS
jgi:DNA-binding CsgD family transcriptional regulator